LPKPGLCGCGIAMNAIKVNLAAGNIFSSILGRQPPPLPNGCSSVSYCNMETSSVQIVRFPVWRKAKIIPYPTKNSVCSQIGINLTLLDPDPGSKETDQI
jgi:hypothetical protein